MELDDKIFIYLRLRVGDKIITKSKVREFAAVGNLLADFTHEQYKKDGPMPTGVSNFEFVEASSDKVLVSFSSNPERSKFIISGNIPKLYQKRMLDPQAKGTKVSSETFVEKAGRDLEPGERYRLLEGIQSFPLDILSLIKNNIDENGNFHIVLELPRQ